MRKLALLLSVLLLFAAGMPALADEPASPSFSVKVPADFEGELNGRCLIALSRENTEDSGMPYEQVDPTGVPVFGKTVFGLKAGDTITFTVGDAEVYGFPFQLGDIPKEELYAQAFFIRYTKFERAAGPAIWGMADLGGGGSFTANPLNMYSAVADKQLIDVSAPKTIELELTETIPTPEIAADQVYQQGNYPDTDLVKYVKIQSKILSDWWGTPMYLGANVLLPKNYDPAKKYPVLYYQGHFPGGGAPLSYGRNEAFTQYWDGDEAVQMIVITFRDATPFYDTSYSVNSANQGPWGDAIMNELIPELESRFSIIQEPWARMLSGGSTGGWESLAMMIFYPDFFGGTWSLCPDGVDFHNYQIVNIYDDDNAYYFDRGWVKVERPGARAVDGNIRYMMKDENLWEIAVGGLNAMSLGQWAVWEATYGPMGEDGYPKRIWDPLTGKIDKEVAEYWKQNYDLNAILQRDWAELGPKLKGKIHLRGGDMDAYYLNLGQYRMAEFLESTTEPYYEGYSVTFPRMGHTGNITNMALLQEMADHMIKYGPEDAQSYLYNK